MLRIAVCAQESTAASIGRDAVSRTAHAPRSARASPWRQAGVGSTHQASCALSELDCLYVSSFSMKRGVRDRLISAARGLQTPGAYEAVSAPHNKRGLHDTHLCACTAWYLLCTHLGFATFMRTLNVPGPSVGDVLAERTGSSNRGVADTMGEYRRSLLAIACATVPCVGTTGDMTRMIAATSRSRPNSSRGSNLRVQHGTETREYRGGWEQRHVTDTPWVVGVERGPIGPR